MNSHLDTKIRSFIGWIWYQFTKGVYKRELQLLIAPFVMMVVQESFNIIYPKIPAYVQQSGTQNIELETLLDYSLWFIYYITTPLALIFILCWFLLPGYFIYTFRYKNKLKQRPEDTDFWLITVLKNTWQGKYRSLLIITTLLLLSVILNSLSWLLVPELPTLVEQDYNTVIESLNDFQILLYFVYNLTFLIFGICIVLAGYYVNKILHPIPPEESISSEQEIEIESQTDEEADLDEVSDLEYPIEESEKVTEENDQLSQNIPDSDGTNKGL